MEGMESPNPLVRLAVYGRMKRMILDYRKTKLKEVDKRLLRGVFLRHFKDFDEDYNDQASQ